MLSAVRRARHGWRTLSSASAPKRAGVNSGAAFAAVRRGDGGAVLSQNPNIIHRNTLRKMKRGLDRLPSQGPDPAAEFKHGWRLATAAVLERYPVVIPETDDFEFEYQQGRFLDQQRQQRPMPKEWFMTEKDKLEGREPTVDDPRAAMYEPAPRVTAADKTGDTKSLERALDKRLYFVVRRTPNAKHWQFPQVLAADPEVPLREYTTRALNSVIPRNSRPKVHHLSYLPTSHLEHVFGDDYQAKHDVYGVKIFFYRIILMKGQVDEITQAHDFAWATEDELEGMFSKPYFEAVKPMLLSVGPA